MGEFFSVENGCSDSTSPISEPPDITNWFSSYVYESVPLSSSVNESENNVNLGVTVSDTDHKSMNKSLKQISDRNLYESLPSEPPNLGNWYSSYVYESPMLDTSDGPELSDPGEIEIKEKKTVNETPKIERNDVCHKFVEQELVSSTKISNRSLYESLPSESPNIGNWFSSYVYESPLLDTSDGLELSVPGEIECLKEKETENEPPKIERNDVCHKLYEQELGSCTKVTNSQSRSLLSEPPDVRNWFSSYEYQSPQLPDTQELGFSSFGKEELIIDDSDTEEENSRCIFRKTKSKQEPIPQGRLESNDCKDNKAANTAKEIFSDDACSGQEMNKQMSVGLLNASKKEVKQESSFKHEPLFCIPKEAKFNPGVSHYSPKGRSSSKNETSLHELGPKNIQETISTNSKRQNSPIDQESNDKENVHGQSTGTGFVSLTMKKTRIREARDRCSMVKPNTDVLAECSRSKRLKNNAKEEDKEERNKKRRVLEEMSNHRSSGAKEIAGKWLCPQKNKRNIVPPLKQLRLDVWVHKV